MGGALELGMAASNGPLIRSGERGPERVVAVQYRRILFDDADDLTRDQLQVIEHSFLVHAVGARELAKDGERAGFVRVDVDVHPFANVLTVSS